MRSLKEILLKHFNLNIELVRHHEVFMYCPKCDIITMQKYEGWDGNQLSPLYFYKCLSCKKKVESKIKK